MPSALLFDPYVDTLGGGERYTLTVAETLLKQGYQVTLAWPFEQIIPQAADRFGLQLTGLRTSAPLHSLFTQSQNLLKRFQLTHDFDLIFFVSDGSIPILFGKRNLLHYQVPFTRINRFPLANQAKLLTIHQIVVNSEFTKSVIDKTLGIRRSLVLYPPVDVAAFSGKTVKKKQILNVGRIASPSHSKRQDILIEAFRKLCHLTSENWQLILAGGVTGSEQPLKDLKRLSTGLDVEFVLNPDYKELIRLYRQSSIYWHAAGYEVDETLNPEAVEHFGITTVEAMAAGCVPVVIAKGGQKEVVDIDSGYLCQTIDDIVAATAALIASPEVLHSYSQACRLRVNVFSKSNFADKFLKIIV